MRPIPALAPILALILSITAASAQTGEEDRRELTVTGTGEVSAAPDMASIDIGVTSGADTARAALDANSAAMRRVMQALREAGIAEKDIQTRGFNVQPRYHHDPKQAEPPRVVGYEVSNTVHVEIRDLGRLGPVLDEAVSEGSNTINGLSFGFSEPEKLTDEARRAAGADARRKAELYAAALGVDLGPIVRIEEAGGGAPPAPYLARTMAMDAASVPVAAGEQTVRANLSVTWEIR